MKDFEFGDLFKFEKMVAPTVLKVVYWLGLIGMVIMCLVSISGAFGMMGYSAATGLGMLLLSIIGLAFGVLIWRIVIEIYMVIFSMNERLGAIRDRLPPQP
ncbi:MAG: hypothetical protein CVT78_08565 [Alphaproteobacteria bacterium HGW-Alphaproteobacteria-17]|uniref:DUF4282 domain-containing protein n=1 Tax=Sphingopyxis solisilvae TaxID=1886788 RepID=UPI000CC7D9A2|nr:DUF4282 domain-containing protein [Sphingopyxis solisilvae]PKP87172.1 MAG: hypothetical protein CVT78_08565 [Alphaproteobacteria bacterium HGW-Alphaproteobacteria-17]